MSKNYIKFAVIGALMLSAPWPASAQVAPIQAQVVAACGTPQTPYSAGQTRPATQDTTGTLCTASGGGGGTSNVAITAPLGNQAKSAAVAVTAATASAIAPTVVALSTTASQVLATGTGFVSRIVCNDDSAIVEYFGPSGVTNAGANGVKVQPGQCWDFSHNTAAIYGVSASATPNARVVQY